MVIIKFSKKRKGGFTLIELMVVIMIILVLTSFAVLIIDNARRKTKDAIIITAMEQLKAIAETNYNPQNGYRELSLMVGDTTKREDDHEKIGEIRDKLTDMGATTLRVWFPEDGNTGDGWGEYCAYAKPLFYAKGKYFCIDSSGAKVIGSAEEISCKAGATTKIYCTEE
jgi:prepilin-type N-terminal cleavage/methylation domain-containing protein